MKAPTLIKLPVSVRDVFNFVDICSAVGIVRSTTTRTRVNDAAAVTFSVKCYDPLKLCPLSANILTNKDDLQKVVYFILFIYSGAFNNNVISTVNLIAL